MYKHLLIIAVVLISIQLCTAASIDGCTYTYTDDSGDYDYDLSALAVEDGGAYYNGLIGEERAYMQMCGVNHQSTDCENASGAVCLYDTTLAFLSTMALWQVEPTHTFSLINENDPASGIMMHYTNGYFLNPDVLVNVSVKIPCSPANKNPVKDLVITSDMDYTNFVITMDANYYGCSIQIDPVNPSKKGGNSNGVSSGTFFCIFLICCAFLYLSIGMIYNSTQLGKSGTEMIPNIEVWRNLPSLVAEGISFTIMKLRSATSGISSKSAVNYEEV